LHHFTKAKSEIRTTIGGRIAVVTDLGRVRRGLAGKKVCDLIAVEFIDTGEYFCFDRENFANWCKERETASKIPRTWAPKLIADGPAVEPVGKRFGSSDQ
jgi:hypothetical protein